MRNEKCYTAQIENLDLPSIIWVISLLGIKTNDFLNKIQFLKFKSYCLSKIRSEKQVDFI